MSDAIEGVRGWGAKLKAVGGDHSYIPGRVGAAAVVMMQLRTAVGVDVDGQRFAPYSIKPAYIYDQAGSTSFRSANKALRKSGGVKLERGALARADKAAAARRQAQQHGGTINTRSGSSSGSGGGKIRTRITSKEQGPGFRTATRSPNYFPGGYAQAKQQMGHPVEDLVVTGQMMGAMGNTAPFGVEEVGNNFVIIGVLDQSQLKKMDDNNKTREFWGVGRTPDEHSKLQAVANAALGDFMRHHIRGEALKQGVDE